jgi:hypothetical protein
MGEFATHIGKIIAVNKNGIERKGKYKRISRSKEYQIIINTLGETRIRKNYQESANERREKVRTEKEEEDYYWEQQRKDNYYKRRKSAPKFYNPQNRK